ncbi:uncharacterized protein EV154DRAFT_573678 [Mucor mucedo]|uniref:uncharacterized protein n=1 Tax=Mucor mucedo TaxID=29922 RepID=UPI00221E4399|nr:uncharacterized protein EV154DRAFT_573678 [Mucor mucedo]KAI7887622.1 hypothetical protein EV154DRAFT_573678 [Mucor mucedo]
MDTSLETLEHQTAPESTRGFFEPPSADKKFPSHRESAPVPDKRRSLGPGDKLSRPPSFQPAPSQQGSRGHQRSRSSSDLVSNLSANGRRNNFGLQTLVEEEDAHRKNKSSNLDSLQDMINTLKNLPPIISNPVGAQQSKGHRKQHSMSALVSGNGNNQVTNNKRLSYNNSSNNVSDMQTNVSFDNTRRPTSSSADLFDNGNIFNHLSRDEALAEAEAKLMGTFQPKKKMDGRRNSDVRPPSSRRYSESQPFDHHPISTSVSSGLTSKRTSLQMPTLNENVATENGSGRRIVFNKPLNLSATTKEDTLNESKRLSSGHQRRSSRNLDFDWRASNNGGNSSNPSSNRNSFQLVPFTPTRVNFARDDANPHQRRPLFIAHLPFSALPPLFRSRQLSRGALRVNKRNRSDAYVYCDDLDDDIYICGSRDRNRALEGDVVAVRLVDVDKVLREKKEKEEAKLIRNGGQARVRLPDEEDENEIIFGGDEDVDVVKPKYCGVVVAILERAQNQVFSGTLTLMRPNNKRAQEEKAAEEARKSIHGNDVAFRKEAPRIVWFKSTDKRVPLIAIPIEQAPNDFVDHSEAYSTSLFVGSMKRWPITSLHPFGTLERELGSVYELSTQTKAIFADNNVTDCDFSEAVLSCLPSIPFHLEADASRRDLRSDTLTFTIDPKGSNVLDDALSIKRLDAETWEVGVHISDVTYFIKSQSALDKEARARAVRVDLIHTFVPMIPQELTEQVTNLSPNESRFTVSVIWKMNNKGEIIDTWFGKTIIRSSAQLTYDDAQKILDHRASSDEQVSKDIVSLSELASLLRDHRQSNGIFTQTRDELEYEFKDEEPVTVSVSHKNAAAMMVKEFLFLANKSVAQKISSQFPNHALLRRQSPPSERKIKELCAYASRHLGVQLDSTNAGTLEASIRSIGDSKLRKLVSVIVLKTLQAPKYFCSGSVDIVKYQHYSLNIPLFTHFTAPSRRFADIIVHRQLEASLEAGEKRFSLDRDTVQKLAQHCNVKKDAAIYARDQSNLMFLSVHMNKLSQQQVPQAITTGPSLIFREAIVVAVFDQFFDVMIPELNLEKRIHLASLPVWRSDYDATHQSLTMFWRKGVDTSSGKKVEWNLSDEEDEEDMDDMDDAALLEEMIGTGSFKEEEEEVEEYKNAILSEKVVSRLAVQQEEKAPFNVFPNKSISTPVLMNRRPETSRSSNRRASIVRARLSDSTAFSTEQGFQTLKALDKIRVVLIIELVRTPPVIRILAANPFS